MKQELIKKDEITKLINNALKESWKDYDPKLAAFADKLKEGIEQMESVCIEGESVEMLMEGFRIGLKTGWKMGQNWMQNWMQNLDDYLSGNNR